MDHYSRIFRDHDRQRLPDRSWNGLNSRKLSLDSLEREPAAQLTSTSQKQGSAVLHQDHIDSLLQQIHCKPRWKSQKHTKNVINQLGSQNGGKDISSALPLGIAFLLREAAQTCQLAPPRNWPLRAYRAIGRNDLAASATENPDMIITEGYKSRKEWINPTKLRETIGQISSETRTHTVEVEPATGVELNLKEFTDVRFT